MKRIIQLLFATVLLMACSTIDEDNTDCLPDGNIHVSFGLKDDYISENRDYDSRIGNEVLLYFFKDNLLTYSELIPYEKIRENAEHVIRKTPDITGDIELVAWAVPAGKTFGEYLHQYDHRSVFDNHFLAHTRTRADNHYQALPHDLYLGRLSTTEIAGKDSHRNVDMMVAACRVVVNITDNLGVIPANEDEPRIEIDGIMSQMNLRKQATGSPAIVTTQLLHPQGNPNLYTTGYFGVLPSGDGQTVSVKIFTGDTVVATLTLPEDKPAISGGHIVIDYELKAAYFELTIDDWANKIYTVEYL